MALTAKQALFVKEYLVDLNATAAYLRAGYKDTPAARANSARLIANDSISEAIAKANTKRLERVEWSADDILRDLKKIAESDNEMTKDRLKAYELGGKAAGMFKDKVELTGDEGGPLKVTFNIPRPQR